MTKVNFFDLNEELEELAELLDIPDSVYEQATSRYDDVAEWLSRDDSPLRRYEPTIYPQGSFRLGTVVRPPERGGEFDIDLVCRLSIPKEQTTQVELKHRVGERLEKNEELVELLEELRRCWRLNYPGEFHLDVLPALPDEEASEHCILLTDRELRLWQRSNPIGYADWFFERMRVVLEEQRGIVASAAGVSVEEVPYWQVRTPLQRAVQLLKRHRDVHFDCDDENRPVSIIITTLAAAAYGQERDVESALRSLVHKMPDFIECRQGKWWVENPANPAENFTDKWNESPERREAFLGWLNQVQADLGAAVTTRSAVTGRQRLFESFGMAPPSPGGMITSAALPALVEEVVPALAGAAHVESPRWPVVATGFKCQVRGAVYRRRGGQRKLWDLTNRPVPKGCALLFRTDTNVPRPYEVHWQVVNTGAEAALADGLRGDFYSSDSGTTRWETTAYAGTHWVEAFVVKDGVVCARSGRKFVKVKK